MPVPNAPIARWENEGGAVLLVSDRRGLRHPDGERDLIFRAAVADPCVVADRQVTVAAERGPSSVRECRSWRRRYAAKRSSSLRRVTSEREAQSGPDSPVS